MKTTQYIYNNEAISIIAILAVLKELNQLDIAKSMLILPLLYHKRTLSFLEKNDTKTLSLEEFSGKNILLSNFNNRFLTYLPITINSISMLKEMNLISIENNVFFLNSDNKFDIHNEKLGNRAKSIVTGALSLSNLLNEETNNLYLQLRIEL